MADAVGAESTFVDGGEFCARRVIENLVIEVAVHAFRSRTRLVFV